MVGDFNGDGIPDIVVANGEATQNDDGVVTLFLGTADGGLGLPVSFNAGASPFYPGTVAAGDLNGDGLLDLAVIGGYGSNTVSILLGDGGGGFAPPIQSIVDPATAGPGESLLFETYQVAIGNFTGGTQKDLAILYSDEVFQNAVAIGGGSTALVIYSGFSGSALGPPTTYPLTTLPDQTAAIAMGDFDGDGADDLAMVWSYAFGNQGVVYGSGAVFLSKSQKVDQNFNFGGPVGAIAAGDFTGDGNLDLAIGATNVYDEGSIYLFRGAGDGSFIFQSSYDAGILPVSLAAADFNGDGVLDLAMSGQSTTSTILVNTIGLMYGLLDGGFSEPTFASAQGADVTGVLWPTVLALDVRGEPGVAVVGSSTDGGSYVTLLDGVCQ